MCWILTSHISYRFYVTKCEIQVFASKSDLTETQSFQDRCKSTFLDTFPCTVGWINRKCVEFPVQP